jgi:hypothetical protein
MNMNLNHITADFLKINSRNQTVLTDFIEAGGFTHYSFAPFYWGSSNINTQTVTHYFHEFARELKTMFPQVSFAAFVDRVTDETINEKSKGSALCHIVFNLPDDTPNYFHARMAKAFARQSSTFEQLVTLTANTPEQIVINCQQQLQRIPFAGFEAIILNYVLISAPAEAA